MIVTGPEAIATVGRCDSDVEGVWEVSEYHILRRCALHIPA